MTLVLAIQENGSCRHNAGSCHEGDERHLLGLVLSAMRRWTASPRFGACRADRTTWFAVAAPPATSAETAARIARALDQALSHSDVQRRLVDFSATPVGGGPAAAAHYLKTERERWRAVIMAAGIELQ